MPVDDGMDAHEVRPASIGGVEVHEFAAVRVCPSCANEYCPYLWMLAQVVGEAFFHRFGVAGHGKVVVLDGRSDKVFDGLEGMLRHYVHGVQAGGEPCRRGMVLMMIVGLVGCMKAVNGPCVVGVEGAEVEDQQDEAVLAAIIRYGQLLGAIAVSISMAVAGG